jgi:hypothetical protein
VIATRVAAARPAPAADRAGAVLRTDARGFHRRLLCSTPGRVARGAKREPDRHNRKRGGP